MVLTLIYNLFMLKVLLFDRLFQVLIVLIVTTFSAWAFAIFVYPFGLLVLLSVTCARLLHLCAMQDGRANKA